MLVSECLVIEWLRIQTADQPVVLEKPRVTLLAKSFPLIYNSQIHHSAPPDELKSTYSQVILEITLYFRDNPVLSNGEIRFYVHM
jgi:hypothetical protein